MGDLLKVVMDTHILDIAIVAMGIFSLIVIADRTKVLFFDYALKADAFMKQIKSLLEADKIEEAITFCAANQKKPLAHVVKMILERSDRDDAAIDKGVDIAVAEVAPGITRRLGYLSMIGNVSTMIGLLGTVFGLIMSFKAISFADPAQKQTLLADGIAMAMHATAMGLAIAIPTMVVYSFLHARQGRLFSEIDEVSQKVVDLLRSRTYQAFSEKSAFPDAVNLSNNGAEKSKKPSLPTPSKVS